MNRARVYSTEAFVLRRLSLGEADRIVTLFTPAEGKLRAIAKGARRPASRLAGHLELFSLSLFQLAQGRELDVITQAESRESFRAVREDLTRTTQAYYALELIDRLTPDRQPNRALYARLHELLLALGAEEPSALALPYFAIQALGALGYRPQLAECLHCNATIEPGANYFSHPLGGVLCPRCGPAEPTAQAIPVNVLKALRYLQRTPRLAEVRALAPNEVVGGAEAVLRAYGEYLLEHRLRAGEFLDRLRLDTRLHAPAADVAASAISERAESAPPKEVTLAPEASALQEEALAPPAGRGAV